MERVKFLVLIFLNVQWNYLNSLSKALCISKQIWTGCVEWVQIIQVNLTFPTIFPSKSGCILYKCAYYNQISVYSFGPLETSVYLYFTCKIFDIESSFWWDGTSSSQNSSFHVSRLSGQGQGHGIWKKTMAGGPALG